MMNHTPLADDEVAACPECGRASISMGTRDHPMTPNPEKGSRYRCKKCNAALESFEVRERDNDMGGRQRGLARELLEADPGEVGR